MGKVIHKPDLISFYTHTDPIEHLYTAIRKTDEEHIINELYLVALKIYNEKYYPVWNYNNTEHVLDRISKTVHALGYPDTLSLKHKDLLIWTDGYAAFAKKDSIYDQGFIPGYEKDISLEKVLEGTRYELLKELVSVQEIAEIKFDEQNNIEDERSYDWFRYINFLQLTKNLDITNPEIFHECLYENTFLYYDTELKKYFRKHHIDQIVLLNGKADFIFSNIKDEMLVGFNDMFAFVICPFAINE